MRIGLLRESTGFRNLWLGQAISQVGDSLYYAGFMFLVKRLTGRDDMVGYIGAAEVLPYLLLSPYAGVVVDRIDRRLVLLLSDLLSAAVLVFMSIIAFAAGSPPLWSLFVGATLLSCFRVFFYPAKNASIPRLVPEKEVTNAFAFSYSTQTFMQLAGTALTAGVIAQLYGQFGSGKFFQALVLLNAATFVLSGLFVFRLPSIEPERAGEKPTVGEDLRLGLQYVRRRADLTVMLLVTMLFLLGVSPFFVAYVAANDAWFGGKAQTLSWFEFAFFLGMFAGNFVVAKFPPKRPGLSFIVALLGVGVGVGLMAIGRTKLGFASANLFCGLFCPFADIPKVSWMQLTVPDEYRGRVNSLNNMVSTGMMPVGMVLAGAAIARLGVDRVFFLMGGLMVLAALLGLLGKEFREARMPDGQTGGINEGAEHPEPIIA